MKDEKRDELNRLIGASDMISLLLEEMEQWLEEAQNESKQETLENVVGHLSALQEEYRRRRVSLEEAVAKT
ncbi:MAG: hypothetical protein ACK2T3_00120 [Candidatus Promineifilaceae bacterium]|jgi:hypothetical protein